MAITLDGTAGTTTPALTNSALTSGRVTYAGTSGVLQDSANMTFSGTALTLANDASINGLTVGKGTGNGAANTVFGTGAYASGTKDAGCTAIGYQAMQNATDTFGNNTAIGYQAGRAITSGGNNTLVGTLSGLAILTGTDNSALGYSALGANTSGSENTAIGRETLKTSTTAKGNTALGYAALYTSNRTADVTAFNTGIGHTALFSLSTGQYNTTIGYQAGYNLTTGNNNTIVGYGSQASAVGGANQVVLGAAITGQGDSYVTIGSGSGKIYNAFTVNATWTQTSDGRLKTNINDDSLGLSFINRLRPVTFTWKPSNEIDPSLPYYKEINERDTTTVIHGLIAQEVKAALDAEGCTTFNGWDAGNEDTIQAISREMFISPLIKAIQELTARVAALEAK